MKVWEIIAGVIFSLIGISAFGFFGKKVVDVMAEEYRKHPKKRLIDYMIALLRAAGDVVVIIVFVLMMLLSAHLSGY